MNAAACFLSLKAAQKLILVGGAAATLRAAAEGRCIFACLCACNMQAVLFMGFAKDVGATQQCYQDQMREFALGYRGSLSLQVLSELCELLSKQGLPKNPKVSEGLHV